MSAVLVRAPVRVGGQLAGSLTCSFAAQLVACCANGLAFQRRTAGCRWSLIQISLPARKVRLPYYGAGWVSSGVAEQSLTGGCCSEGNVHPLPILFVPL